jgi:hypothetical protein
MGAEVKMSRVILDIKNNQKGKYLLDFLRQVDFLEITEEDDDANSMEQTSDKVSIEDILLNAPVLTEEEIKDIENIGKEFRNWKIEEF